MRRVNGSGSVYKLKDVKRRRPWVAMASRKNEFGILVKHAVGYYATRQEAVAALEAYNVDPYADVPQKTMDEIFRLWIEEYSYIAAPKTVKTYTYMWNAWSPYHEKPIKDVKASDLQHHIDTIDKTPASKAAMKKVMAGVYEFAMKNDYVNKNAGSYLYIPSRSQGEPKHPHVPYTDDEIRILWDHQDDDMAALQLLLIYCGCRIGEILDLDTSDVDMDKKTFLIRQAKTQAGIRTVPIADKAVIIWQRFLARSGKHLIVSEFGNEIRYQAVRVLWDKFNDSIGIQHTPHDCRHTAITRMTAAGVDDRIIKKVVGHKSNNVTVDVYTHMDMEQLRNAVNKI